MAKRDEPLPIWRYAATALVSHNYLQASAPRSSGLFLRPPVVSDFIDHPGHQHGQDPKANHLHHEGRHRRSP